MLEITDSPPNFIYSNKERENIDKTLERKRKWSPQLNSGLGGDYARGKY